MTSIEKHAEQYARKRYDSKLARGAATEGYIAGAQFVLEDDIACTKLFLRMVANKHKLNAGELIAWYEKEMRQ